MNVNRRLQRHAVFLELRNVSGCEYGQTSLEDRKYTENCALLGYYAASSGNFLQTFRENLSVPSSGLRTLRMAEE